MFKILVASNNKGKIKEIKEIFNEFEVYSLKDFNLDIEVKEDKNTFSENALKKAEEIAKLLDENIIVLSDDSGICIDSLDGFPGVKTKRWLDGTDRERNLGLIKKLEGSKDRTCHFITAIAIANKEISHVVEEVIDGTIALKPKGNNGFGFDEIFVLKSGKTLAELTDEYKNEISARKKALEKAKKYILNI